MSDKPESWKKYTKPKSDKELKLEIEHAQSDYFKMAMCWMVLHWIGGMFSFVVTVYLAHELWGWFDGR